MTRVTYHNIGLGDDLSSGPLCCPVFQARCKKHVRLPIRKNSNVQKETVRRIPSTVRMIESNNISNINIEEVALVIKHHAAVLICRLPFRESYPFFLYALKKPRFNSITAITLRVKKTFIGFVPFHEPATTPQQHLEPAQVTKPW